MATTINAQAPWSAAGAAATSGGTSSTKGGGELDRDAFMKLLVAQLAHQDPMQPSDPSQFVSQLSQFTSLEQLVNMKDGMDLLAVTQTAGTSAQMVSFIGKDVRFDGSSVVWQQGDDPVTTTYKISGSPSEVEVHVVDKDGKTIETYPVPANATEFTFDGLKKDGTKIPDGTYHIEVDAKDKDGKTLKVAQQSTGRVSGVTFEGGYPQLMLADGRTIGLSQVIEVLAGAATTPNPTPASNDQPVTDTDESTSQEPTEP
ncbi:MAG: flagellar hook assembly protein FlgD [Myxococcota bacterium]